MLLFLFVGSLLSASLQEADYYLQQPSKGEILKAYNQYKSLYIKSLIDNDKRLRLKVLKGLIASSKKLGFPYRDYLKELYALEGKKVSRRISLEHVKDKRIRSIRVRGDTITILSNFSPERGDINHFVLKRRDVVKSVWDIKAKAPFSFRKYSLKRAKIRIARYKPTITRLVIESKKPLKDRLVFLDRGFKILLGSKPAPFRIQNQKRTIVIDAGHGGKDSGAIGYKRKREKDIVLAIAKRVAKRLKKEGFRVYLTRKGDYFVTLRNRTKFANRVGANLFVSIHANAAPKRSKYLSMKGLETFYLSPARSARAKRVAALENRAVMKDLSYYSKNVFLDFINREKMILSNKLAIDIQKNVLRSVRRRYSLVDGGVRPGPFWVLVGAQMPSVLVEVGYITNPTEAKRLSSPYYQELIAKGIVEGVKSYFRHNK